jgi:hypothetical protein
VARVDAASNPLPPNVPTEEEQRAIAAQEAIAS